jgi:P2-related tail formation protein
MGVFWSYIKDTLRWPLIFRPGPLSAVLEGLARVFDEIRGDMVWLRDQFSPATCDEEQLSAHAESRGINRYPLESQEQYHRRVLKAYAWNTLGGGQRGMPRILEHYGYPGAGFKNVREEDSERWAEFKASMGVPEGGLELKDYALATAVIQDQKPARSILAGLGTTSEVAGSVKAAGLIITSVVSHISPDWPTEATVEGGVEARGYIHTVIKTTI